jgi:hypothetical protein
MVFGIQTGLSGVHKSDGVWAGNGNVRMTPIFGQFTCQYVRACSVAYESEVRIKLDHKNTCSHETTFLSTTLHTHHDGDGGRLNEGSTPQATSKLEMVPTFYLSSLTPALEARET